MGSLEGGGPRGAQGWEGELPSVQSVGVHKRAETLSYLGWNDRVGASVLVLPLLSLWGSKARGSL